MYRRKNEPFPEVSCTFPESILYQGVEPAEMAHALVTRSGRNTEIPSIYEIGMLATAPLTPRPYIEKFDDSEIVIVCAGRNAQYWRVILTLRSEDDGTRVDKEVFNLTGDKRAIPPFAGSLTSISADLAYLRQEINPLEKRRRW